MGSAAQTTSLWTAPGRFRWSRAAAHRPARRRRARLWPADAVDGGLFPQDSPPHPRRQWRRGGGWRRKGKRSESGVLDRCRFPSPSVRLILVSFVHIWSPLSCPSIVSFLLFICRLFPLVYLSSLSSKPVYRLLSLSFRKKRKQKTRSKVTKVNFFFYNLSSKSISSFLSLEVVKRKQKKTPRNKWRKNGKRTLKRTGSSSPQQINFLPRCFNYYLYSLSLISTYKRSPLILQFILFRGEGENSFGSCRILDFGAGWALFAGDRKTTENPQYLHQRNKLFIITISSQISIQ